MPNRKAPAIASASKTNSITSRALSEWRRRWWARWCQRLAMPRVLGLRTQGQAVARVAPRLDRRQRLQLLAQATDHDVHGTGVQLRFVAAQAVEDVVAAEHLARFARQQQ